MAGGIKGITVKIGGDTTELGRSLSQATTKSTALVNQILTTTGHAIIPITDDQITQIITLGFTIGASLLAWWKNNSFSKQAIEADEYMKSLKRGE